MKINAAGVFSEATVRTFDVPGIGTCPVCHHSIEAVPVGPHLYVMIETQPWPTLAPDTCHLQVTFRCPRTACLRLFIVRYTSVEAEKDYAYWKRLDVSPIVHRPEKVSKTISAISPQFVKIYQQASAAKHYGLDEICGPGYRKALEFLVKDYQKSLAKDDSERAAIENTQLGACIGTFVDHPQVKKVAARAAWLGNDETHYRRKWEEKDVSDLKKLIDLTLHWIEASLLTKELETSMPDPKANARAAE